MIMAAHARVHLPQADHNQRVKDDARADSVNGHILALPFSDRCAWWDAGCAGALVSLLYPAVPRSTGAVGRLSCCLLV